MNEIKKKGLTNVAEACLARYTVSRLKATWLLTFRLWWSYEKKIA